MSLRKLAIILGLSAPFISDIELGRRYPSESVMEKMAAVFGIPVERLRVADPRVPVQELRKLVSENPAYGIVLRKLVDGKIAPEDILSLSQDKKSGDGQSVRPRKRINGMDRERVCLVCPLPDCQSENEGCLRKSKNINKGLDLLAVRFS